MLALAAVLAAAPVLTVRAQELRGTVLQLDGATPASGVVVLLLRASGDSTGAIVARVTTGERGLFTLKAPVVTPVLLRFLRIGQQPTTDGPYTLSAGETRELRITLPNTPVSIAAVNVRANTACQVRPDGASVVAQLYEEARKALLASASTVSGSTTVAQFTQYVRRQDDRGRLTMPTTRSTSTRPTSKPFVSRGVALLEQSGYVLTDNAGVTYFAPDAEVLLSDRFLATHCLQLVDGTGDRTALVGVGFRPVGRRPNIVDVEGVMWLDRATTMLQRIEFTYDPQSAAESRAGVGGQVEFTRLPNGFWFVNRWNIRMPRKVVRQQVRMDGVRLGAVNRDAAVEGLEITGGEVQSVRIGQDLVYRADLSALASAEMGQDRAADGSGGMAVLANVSADGSAAMPELLCPAPAARERSARGAVSTGAAAGRVLDQGGAGMSATRIIAEWQENIRAGSSGASVRWTTRTLEVESGEQGRYLLCGLPSQRLVTLVAVGARARSKPVSLYIEDGGRIAIDLVVPR